jgi:hypothetical protein
MDETARPCGHAPVDAAPAVTRASLRPDRARFVAALLSGLGVEQAAVAAGRDRSTGFRWMRREDVRLALEEAQRAGREVAGLVLQGAAVEAASVVQELLSPAVDPQTRLRAALAVLDRVGLVAGSKVDVTAVPPDADPAQLSDAELADRCRAILDRSLRGGR